MSKASSTPPKLADRFLSWFCRDELLEEVRGDLHEYYGLIIAERGSTKAWWIYWFHVIHFVRPFALKRTRQNSNINIMYKSYFKFAWRNMIKHKGSTLMNMLSLSVGIACFIFIFVFLEGELGYDKFHDDADRIHRVAIDFVDGNGRRLPDATTPPALAPALKREFPEVAASVRVYPNWGSKFLLGATEDTKFFEEDLIRTDSTFFDVFSFPLVYGNKADALDAPDQMLISRKAAVKYFGREDVVGETITMFGEENQVFRISGVLENVPYNSHFKFDFVSRLGGDNLDTNWGQYNYYTYMKLTPAAEIAGLEPRLQPFFESNLSEAEFYNIIYSQPLTDIHLKSHLKWELEANGDINNVYIFTALGIFILIISCINYLNLTVAESLRRFKEVGVRKVFGAHRKSLIGQFLVETTLVIVLSLLMGAVMAELLFTNLSDMLGREVSLLSGDQLSAFLTFSAVILTVGMLAGLYPALHLSSFKVAQAVKGTMGRSGKPALGLRKTLLVIQFAISAFMIFGSIAVYQQLQHMKGLDKGFDPQQVLVIENADNITNQQTLKTELTKIPAVTHAGVSNGIIGGINWTFGVGYPDAFTMNYVAMDPEFVDALGFELIAGRNFSRELETDRQGLNMVVNETGLKELGLSLDDVGKSVPMLSNSDTTTVNGTVVGVVKDFHFTDFKSEIKPFAFFYRDDAMPYLNVNMSVENVQATLQEIENVWYELSNGAPFEYYFLDQTFADLQAQESRLADILQYLTLLALFIAFMGMFAIANLSIKDRRKEIAIRKVLGASVSGVSNMITGKFLLLVLLANAIAGPLAYFIMQNWLDGFAYRTSLGAMLFVAAIASTVVIAWITVGFQSFKAAVSNPVKSLRQE